MWFASPAWDLIWVAWLKFPCSILLGLCRLEDLTLIREKARGDGKGGIFVKMEDKAALNVELGVAERFSLGHCGPAVLVVGAPRVWQSSDCSLLERGSFHSYGKKQALLEHSILQKGKNISLPLKGAWSDRQWLKTSERTSTPSALR